MEADPESQDTTIPQRVLQDRLLDGGEDEADVGGVGRLGQTGKTHRTSVSKYVQKGPPAIRTRAQSASPAQRSGLVLL